jgi:hypothetical protein
MKRFMISFNNGDMKFDPSELDAVAADAHAVLRDAKEAGVWLFGGGFWGDASSTVNELGEVRPGPIAPSDVRLGGFCVIEVATAEEAYHWAARNAKACRCDQEVREMMYDPESTN